jgi:hypothetical protein
LIRLATRRDRSAAPAFSAGLGLILKTEPKLFKAAMRAAFASMIWRWKNYDEEDEAGHTRFGAERAATVDSAVSAEIAWLDGEAEPPWPAWPEEWPSLRHGSRLRVPRLVTPPEFEEEEPIKSTVAESSSTIHVDSQAAAQWLAMLQAAPKGSIDWQQDVAEAYVDWTARMNGLGLPVDIEINHDPREWNMHYYALFAERLLNANAVSFEADLKLVTNLPDEPFGEVAQTVIHSADALYFNDPQRPAARHADLRARLAQRVIALQKWRCADDPASSRIDTQSGGIVAKIMLNTYNPLNRTQSYLPAALFDRLDPLLPTLRSLLPGGPTAFVALCTMNLLLVATRARHLDFLLEATEAWFDRTQAPGLWIDMGIGRKIVQWLEAAIIQEPQMLAPTHPLRARIDRALGQLIGVGIAEARELELRVELENEAFKQ